MTTETREEVIARWERTGDLDPDCSGCQERYAAADPRSVFAPYHKPSRNCESGKYAHCTCDKCF